MLRIATGHVLVRLQASFTVLLRLQLHPLISDVLYYFFWKDISLFFRKEQQEEKEKESGSFVAGFSFGLIRCMPLQLSKFTDLSLQFVILKLCHYNFATLRNTPLLTPSICFWKILDQNILIFFLHSYLLAPSHIFSSRAYINNFIRNDKTRLVWLGDDILLFRLYGYYYVVAYILCPFLFQM